MKLEAIPQPALGKIDRSHSSIDVNLKNLFFHQHKSSDFEQAF